MKPLLSNFLTVSVLLSLAALIVLPESILLGAEILVLLFSILIFFVVNENNISVFSKLCTYFGLLSAGLMVALLRSDLVLLGKNMDGVTTIIGNVLCEGNYIVGYTVISLLLFSLLYISKNELKTIGTVIVTEECENSIKLLKKSSKILYQTAIFTVFIHFCFFAVGVLIALIIAQYSVIGALVEIARKLGGISIIAAIPQLIVCGAFKKLQIAAFN